MYTRCVVTSKAKGSKVAILWYLGYFAFSFAFTKYVLPQNQKTSVSKLSLTQKTKYLASETAKINNLSREVKDIRWTKFIANEQTYYDEPYLAYTTLIKGH